MTVKTCSNHPVLSAKKILNIDIVLAIDILLLHCFIPREKILLGSDVSRIKNSPPGPDPDVWGYNWRGDIQPDHPIFSII